MNLTLSHPCHAFAIPGGATGGLSDIRGGQTGGLADIQGGETGGLRDIGPDRRS